MALIKNLRSFAYLSNSLRNYSTSGPLVDVAVNDKTGVATITLQRPPVNSLNLELLTELASTFQELENNKSRGAILTSSLNSVFSGGVDILELYKPDPERFKQFWSTFQQTWISLYGSSYPTVAVINGHSPAGGCLLSLSCEYRIMSKNFKIGLNETQLGIVAAKWFRASMQNAIGARQTELALTAGTLFSTDEAFKIGMVDEVVQSKEEGLEQANKFLQRFAKIPPLARAMTKKSLRGDDIEDLVKNRQNELDQIMTIINSPLVTKPLGLYLESLKQKQK